MKQVAAVSDVARVQSGIDGLDEIMFGGLPAGRSTLVSGSAGSGKTILALQFLYEGVLQFQEPAVFVTFEEQPDRIRQNASSLGFEIERFEAEGSWVFVDAAFDLDREEEVIGDFDFEALMARIQHAVSTSGAKRVALDSIDTVFARYRDSERVRREMLRVAHRLRRMDVSSLLTSERSNEHGSIARFGVEEYVCDNVVVLRNVLLEESRRRTIEVLKMRGLPHARGEFPFTIIPGQGIVVVTPEANALTAESTEVRIGSGLPELDEMCNGGLFRDSVILVSGATGTGKTLLVTEFIDGGASNGERSLILSFEESRAQLFRNAGGWGRDFAALEESGFLRVESAYPEAMSLEDHLVQIRRVVEEYQPERLAIDSVSALERVAPPRIFREFLIGLTSFVKHQQSAALFTSTARSLLGGESVTEAHISTLTDMIVLLRYIETGAEIRRGLTVLKLRGSTHDKRIHEYSIDGDGMRIGEPFTDVRGILSSGSLPGDVMASVVSS